MRYCARCLYPENARPTIIFDDEGVCSGCRYQESRQKLEINWDERQRMLDEILEEARKLARQRGNSHDCLVPVSGGKDSHFQVWLLKKKYSMNPLLVFFNQIYNQPAGLRNIENLAAKSGCDLITYTAGVDSVRRVSRYMLEKVGEITKQDFYDLVEPMRDAKIWEKQNRAWLAKDAVWKRPPTEANNRHRCAKSSDRTFAPNNRQLYYNPALPPLATGDVALDIKSPQFKIL